MVFTRVSVLIPTRGRVRRLQTLIDSYRATVTDTNAELVFRYDDDDDETHDFLFRNAPVDAWLKSGPRHQGYKSMPLFFNELASSATGDVLMCGNDDMVFRTPDWPTRILEEANKHPDGLFNIGVRTMNSQNFPFSTVSRRTVETLGFIWDPRIFWGDIYLRDVMNYFGRCIYLPDVSIDHDWAGLAPDRTYNEGLEPGEHQKDVLRRDPNYWAITHRGAVDEAVNKLRGATA